MIRTFALSLIGGAILAAAPQPGAAQYSRITIVEAQAALRNAGMTASTTENPSVLRVEGGFIFLTDCNAAGRCAEIKLFNNFVDVRPTLEAVNRWNYSTKIPEASINADGSLHMELWLSGIGLTDALLVDTTKWFARYVADAEFWKPYFVTPGV